VFTFVALARPGTRRSLVIADEPHRQPLETPHLLTTRWLFSSDWAARVSWLIQAATSRELTLHTALELALVPRNRSRTAWGIYHRESSFWNVQLAPYKSNKSKSKSNKLRPAKQNETRAGQQNSHRYQIAVAIQGYPPSFRNINASC
jgi:hypothetical protein